MAKINAYTDKNNGVILPSLQNSQLAFEVIDSMNREILGGSKHDYRAFFLDFGPACINPMFATMNVNELWYYSGLLCTTTLESTKLALKLVGKVQIVFYVWDLEFLRHSKNYFDNLAVYRNPKITLVTRSASYANTLANYCNKQPFIINNFSFRDLRKWLKIK